MTHRTLVVVAVLVMLGAILGNEPSYAFVPPKEPPPHSGSILVKSQLVSVTKPSAGTNDLIKTLPDQNQRTQNALYHQRPDSPPLPQGDPGAQHVSWNPMRPETTPKQRDLPNRMPTGPGGFVIFQDSSIQSVIPANKRSLQTEPSVANRGSVIFQTGNVHTVFSPNSGATFKYIDPSATFTSPTPRGVCCDQVVVYDSTRDLMLWTLLYYDNGTQSVIRLVVLRGDDLVNGRWSYIYDWWSPPGTFYDLPDLCLSANRLWLTANTFSVATNTVNNAYMISMPLDELKAGTTLHTDYIDSLDYGLSNISFRCTRGATNTMYWGSHNSNSQLRVFKWVEGALTFGFKDVNLSPAWNDSPRSCPGPDGLDWCGRAGKDILGAWVANGMIGFMWSAAQGGPFPFPYVEVVRVNESNLTFRDRPYIWSPWVAWAYPSVSPNARGDLGINLIMGGGTAFPNSVVGIVDSYSGDLAANGWELKATDASTQDPNENKWGDYVSVLPFDPGKLVWIGASYTLQGCGDAGCADSHFIIFGREGDRGSTKCYLASSQCTFLPMILR